jgi:hypothetical protein
MVMPRTKFFLALICLFVTPLVLYKAIWLLQSKKTAGIYAFKSFGPALDQIRFPYSAIYFIHGKDTTWFKGPGYLHLQEGTTVPVRYQTGNPAGARVDSFKSIWLDTIVYGGIPILILLVIFLHPEIVPYRSSVELTRRKPFIRVM